MNAQKRSYTQTITNNFPSMQLLYIIAYTFLPFIRCVAIWRNLELWSNALACGACGCI